MNADANLASEYLEALGQPITLSVAICDDYSALLRGDHLEPQSHASLLDLAARRGRVILSGRGGSGKSTIMRRLVVDGSANGKVAILVDLSRWDHSASIAWKVVRDGAREAINFLMQRFGSGSMDVTDLEFLPAQRGKLLVVDGLNETPGTVADEILAACDQAASIIVNCSVIISDRLVRRRTNGDERWYFAMPLAVDIEDARKLLDVNSLAPSAQRLLDSPYFVDKAIRGELKSSPLATIRDFVEARGKLDADGMEAAAEAAFAAYREDESRAFNQERFLGDVGQTAAQTLIEGGVLVALPDGRVAFNHHWIHDYLAARYVATRKQLWSFEQRHASLDTLTFKANSFDAVAFALEELQAESKDEFLRAVYDWNPYAAGYALAEVEEIAPSNISQALRTIILAMLAEKKFDRHYLSARRALDALELFSDEAAVCMRNAADLGELIGIVGAEPVHSEVFGRWQALFTLQSDAPASDATVESVEEDDSIIGWTAANVLKRLLLATPQVDRIVEIAHNERPVIRWRACHVMGSATEEKFRETLLERLVADPDEYVRYGAIRSLVELGSRSSESASRLVDDLEPLLDQIASSPRVMSELKRAIFLSRGCMPEGWSSQISRLLYARADMENDIAEIESWSRLSSELRQHEVLAA